LNELREAARADAEARIGELLRRSCDADMAVQHVLVHGQAASSIVEQACLLKCDLIALGKQGLRMVEEQLLGSVTRQVLEQAQCDVLVCNRVAR
jgi:nucleotide-binding universal stress UspA family protein